LRRVGFVRDTCVPFHEYNLPKPGHFRPTRRPDLRGRVPPWGV